MSFLGGKYVVSLGKQSFYQVVKIVELYCISPRAKGLLFKIDVYVWKQVCGKQNICRINITMD